MTKSPVLSPLCACVFAVQCCGVVGCHRQHRDALWTAAVGGASLPICVRPQVLLAAVGCAHDAILYLSCGRQPDCILWVSNAMHSCCVLTHVAKQGSGIGLWRSGLFFRLTLSSRLHCSATASASRTRHARRQCSRHDRRCRRTSWRCSGCRAWLRSRWKPRPALLRPQQLKRSPQHCLQRPQWLQSECCKTDVIYNIRTLEEWYDDLNSSSCNVLLLAHRYVAAQAEQVSITLAVCKIDPRPAEGASWYQDWSKNE